MDDINIGYSLYVFCCFFNNETSEELKMFSLTLFFLPLDGGGKGGGEC